VAQPASAKPARTIRPTRFNANSDGANTRWRSCFRFTNY
jgi:hypothetical protein